jgi:aminoglycoside phosphotransferase (APT) family kinase protein
MDLADAVRKGEELDWKKIEDYLRVQMPDLSGEMRVGQFHGGHANLTYLLRFGDRELVLRRPPFGKIAPGAHDMKREYKVLSKLYKFFPQAPRAFLLCEDESIAGSKFIIIERRTGVVVRYSLPECFKAYEHAEKRITDAMIMALAQLHKVDVAAADLTNLGRPEGFLERQLMGWAQRWELSKTEEVVEMDEVTAILNENVPIPQAVSIIHNDIKFDNCQFQPDNPDEVTSIFDWDMATIGDPLVDFGGCLGYWPDPLLKGVKMPVVLSGDFPDKAYLIRKYEEQTGFDMGRIGWYQGFAYWKGAIIAQQLYHRYVKGNSADDRLAHFDKAAKGFARIALHYVNSNT